MEDTFDDLSPKVKPPRMARRLVVVSAIIVFLIPGFIFFTQRGSGYFQGLTTQEFSHAIFPLIGLYAFTLVWLQIMIGSKMSLLRNIFPGIERYHRRQGVYIFLFAWLHPLLLLIGVGPTAYLARTYIEPKLVPFVYFGYLQLFLINLTVITALLRRVTVFQKVWRKLHILNYITFFSIWTHSWFLGSDVQHTGLKYLWIFFLLAIATSAIVRYRRGIN